MSSTISIETHPDAGGLLGQLFGPNPTTIPPALQEWLETDQPWSKLTTLVHADLRTRVFRIICGMAVLGYRMTVTDGVRSEDQQYQTWLKGRRNLKNEKIVTWADGKVHLSMHQVQRAGPYKGFAAAVDLAFVNKDNQPDWGEQWPWELYGRMAKSLGLEWGGDWPEAKRDRPHVELSLRLS